MIQRGKQSLSGDSLEGLDISPGPSLAASLLLLLLLSSPCPARSASAVNYPEFIILPYLTDLREKSAVVNWRQASAASSSFRYREAAALSFKRVEVEPGPQYSINIEGLRPGTQYNYLVNDQFEGSFTTPEPGTGFTFVALGHTHGTEQFTHYPDHLLVARVLELKPDFLIHMGDLTYYANIHDFRRYFFDYFRELISRIPVYVSPGNHDAGWPFVYGPQLRLFRSIFRYAYPPEIGSSQGEAFYSVDREGTHFFFLSYSTGIGPQSRQRRWLAKQLEKSDGDFNVVVYGGAQGSYYDQEELLASLASSGVDLVLNGDGFQPKNPVRFAHGMPVIFSGTAGADPQPLVHFEKNSNYLVAKFMDAAGHFNGVRWFYSRRRFDQKVDLNEKPTQVRTRERTVTVVYDFPEPLSSEQIQGLQFVLGSRDIPGQVNFCAYLTPTDVTTTYGNEGGFRTQYQSFSASDPVVTMMFPRENPFKRGAYKIRRISIVFQGIERIEDMALKEFYLF